MQKTPHHKRIAPTSWALGRPALQLALSLSLARGIRKGRATDLVKRVRFRGQRPPRADLADVRVSPGAVVHAIAVNVGNWPILLKNSVLAMVACDVVSDVNTLRSPDARLSAPGAVLAS